jgi:hypothetical protein
VVLLVFGQFELFLVGTKDELLSWKRYAFCPVSRDSSLDSSLNIIFISVNKQQPYAPPMQQQPTPQAYPQQPAFAQPQPMYVQPQVVPVQPVQPVVVVRQTNSCETEKKKKRFRRKFIHTHLVRRQFGEFLNDVDRSFQNTFAPRYVVQVPVAAASPMRVAQCSACMTPLQYQYVGMPVQVKCYRCPNVNVFN